MVKTEKESAEASAKPRGKIRRAKAKVTKALSRHEPPKEATSRLEARIPTDLYEVMERAATLRGLTMTAYVTSTMVSDAQRTIEQSAIIRLSRDDQMAFAKALIDPPAPNARLVAAKRRHAALIR
jgi:uncharacterized protein (DUF1778 family)